MIIDMVMYIMDQVSKSKVYIICYTFNTLSQKLIQRTFSLSGKPLSVNSECIRLSEDNKITMFFQLIIKKVIFLYSK